MVEVKSGGEPEHLNGASAQPVAQDEKIMKLKLFHHYKMKHETIGLMNGDIMPHLCLLIMVILVVSTFGF